MGNPTFTETNHPALYYQSMLADDVRMTRYRAAIEQAVRPGDVVADLGTGTAVLALMAVRAGARRVYAIDNRPHVMAIAECVIQANHAEEVVRLVEGDVREVELEEPIDVIVNELIGDFGTDENIFECVHVFAHRNLKSGGRILPCYLKTFLVPVEYGNEFRGVWRKDFYGIDLHTAVDFPCKSEPVMYGLRYHPKELSTPFLVEDVTFGPDMGERSLVNDCCFKITTAGTLQGFVGYFEATLADGIGIKNYPCYPSCHWENWNWPVSPPLSVEPGQHIEATLTARPDMIAAGWTMDWKCV